ncbi:cell wall protein [Verticillium alfalfae VaMs.102]|uniref:Cell wall protein n=1 Tax=Verticillium alfalfae (strain VaMs.102 / ATCC MYA-4576 / FGSC 10136) TaxID=526221 RepID=C9SNK5_VERA1|nr:cell wall protein [Verticillium alfalfae VaMs.102]EEY20370.1 cell wall protein [Verticillium alfalfae VaMs.102]
MKITTHLTLLAMAAFGSAVAEKPTPVERDAPALVVRELAIVTGVINQVGTGIASLDQAVQAFTTDPTQLQQASQQLINTFRQGATSIQGSTELTLQEAVQLQQLVGSLQTNGQSLVRNLQNKKPAFQQANLCDVVRAQVGEFTTGAGSLIDAIVSKVPQAAQQIAAQMAAGFTRALQESAQGFSSQNCVNAGGAGAGVGVGNGNGNGNNNNNNNNGAIGSTPVTNTTQPGQVTNPSGLPTQGNGASAQAFSVAAAIVAFGAAAIMA